MAEIKKNNPTGMRFDKDKVSFIQTEEKLKSPQQVFNFLVDKYWWEKKIGANPITERMDDFNAFYQKATTKPVKKASVGKAVTVNIKPKTETPEFKSDMEREIWEDEQRILNSKK